MKPKASALIEEIPRLAAKTRPFNSKNVCVTTIPETALVMIPSHHRTATKLNTQPHFFLASYAASQEQTRHIRARNQKHNSCGREHHPQTMARVLQRRSRI